MKRNNKGFTVMELAIVLAVMSILAAITIPSISSKFEVEDISRDKKVVTYMNEALEADEIINGKPNNIDEVKHVISNASLDINEIESLEDNYHLYWYTTDNVLILFNDNNKAEYPYDYVSLDLESESENLVIYEKE